MSPTDTPPRRAGSDTPASAPYPPPVYYADDEIDLFELVEGLWARRYLIAAITVAFAFAALVYAFAIATPVFRATAIVRPTIDATLVRLNKPGVMELTPQEAFARVVFEARSRDTQRAVFESTKEGLLEEWPPEGRSEDDVFFESFVPELSIGISGFDQADEVMQTNMAVSFRHPDADYAAMAANGVTTSAHESAREALLRELRASLRTRIELLEESLEQAERVLRENDEDRIARLQEADQMQRLQLQDRLEALRTKARARREDRMVQLQEALAIAESLDIEEPTTLDVLARNTEDSSAQTRLSANLVRENEPEYLKGARLLRAELGALRARESDEHFFPEIRDIEAELALLENNRQIEILRERTHYAAFIDDMDSTRAEIAELRGFLDHDYSGVSLVQIDQRAVPPRLPEKPNRKLIVAAATVAGGMLAVLIALVLNAAESRRRSRSGSGKPADAG